MNKQLLSSLGFLVLLSGCAGATRIEKTEIEMTMTTQEVLEQHGFPVKVQKYLNLEVWTYLQTNSSGTEKCLFYFRKNKQAGLAKCIITNREPANAKGGFGPRKVVFNY